MGSGVQGDAEDLPLPTDGFDRYVSAGSIEYWPEPQRGICEAYRITKPGGLACLIGPVHPTFWLSRLFADAWMLFPTEDEYMQVAHPPPFLRLCISLTSIHHIVHMLIHQQHFQIVAASVQRICGQLRQLAFAALDHIRLVHAVCAGS